MSEELVLEPAVFTPQLATPPQTPAPAPAAAPVSNTPAAPAEGAAPVTPAAPVVDPRAEINTLASQYGFDPAQFAGFGDANTAREAIRLSLETAVSRAWQTANQPQQAPASQYSWVNPPPAAPAQAPPAAPPAPAYTPIDYKALGLDADEPAAKAFAAQEARLAEMHKQQAAVQDQFTKLQAHLEGQQREQLRQQAETVVSGFASPVFGTSTHRTPVQQMAVEQLFNLADAIHMARPNLSIKERLEGAKLMMDRQYAPQSAAPAQKVGLPQASPSSPPASPTGMKFTETWSANPQMRAILGLPPMA